MEGLTASEMTMIRRLAGNDPLVRKKTIKKLKTWLTAILRRVPDTPDCRDLIENNFLRVWKALFYCMWMADKPLPQEQLAEQISSLVDIFTSKPHVMNLFIEWFFRTMAREWQWIDRFRMDKFMMLVRRFFRKSLEAISQHQWKLEALNGFLHIITVVIFNHHPEVKKTRSKARDPSPEISPLGLQTHVVDIFLEEVAKVGGHRLKSKKILKLLKPFIHELSTNDDERILNEIRERIFCHLMKQSDVGIDYAEGGSDLQFEEDVLSDDAHNESNNNDVAAATSSKSKKNKKKRKRRDDDSDDGGEDADETEEEQLQSGPLDPRAGAVDVILPQLEIDYKELAERLIKVGGQKTVKIKNRKILYNLARQFQELTMGEYPLAIDLEPPKPAIQHKDIEEAAKRLVNLEESMKNPDRKKGQSKRLRKKLGKQRLLDQFQQNDNDNSVESSTDGEGNSSIYLEDRELLDHVSDNYMSYLEELHQQMDDSGEGNGVDVDDDGEEDEEDDGDQTTLDSDDEEEMVDGKVNLSDSEEDDESGEDEEEQDNENLRKSFHAKLNNIKLANKKQMDSSLSNGIKKNSQENPSNLESPTALMKKKKKILLTSTPLSGAVTANDEEDEDEEDLNNKSGCTFVNISSPRPSKKRKLNDSYNFTPNILRTPATASPSSTKRKRVSFVLARNLQHEHSDYKDSIERSPAIPFDSAKKPNYGLLKSPKTPTASVSLSSTPFRSRVSCSSRRASGKF